MAATDHAVVARSTDAQSTHEHWVDILRVVLIAGVVVVHVATGYVVDIAAWYYDDERTSSEFWSTLLFFPFLLGGLFGLGPLFLLAGWFSVPSLERRGNAAFVRRRLVRLGLPLLVFVLLLQPLTDYVGNLRDENQDFWDYLRSTEVSVMWFVVALLVCSVTLALWPERHLPKAAATVPSWRLLLLAGTVIAVTSFAVWTVWPLPSDRWMNLRVAEWPQGAVLFAVGVHAARTGWLRQGLPRRQVHLLGGTALAAASGILALLGVAAALGEDESVMGEPSAFLAGFAVLDGVLAVSGSLWLLSWFRRRVGHWFRRRVGHVGTLLVRAARGSFAAYVIHPLLITTMMLSFAPVALAPELKFLVVSAAGVPAAFAVGYALTRLPGLSRIL